MNMILWALAIAVVAFVAFVVLRSDWFFLTFSPEAEAWRRMARNRKAREKARREQWKAWECRKKEREKFRAALRRY